MSIVFRFEGKKIIVSENDTFGFLKEKLGVHNFQLLEDKKDNESLKAHGLLSKDGNEYDIFYNSYYNNIDIKMSTRKERLESIINYVNMPYNLKMIDNNEINHYHLYKIFRAMSCSEIEIDDVQDHINDAIVNKDDIKLYDFAAIMNLRNYVLATNAILKKFKEYRRWNYNNYIVGLVNDHFISIDINDLEDNVVLYDLKDRIEKINERLENVDDDTISEIRHIIRTKSSRLIM